MVEPRSREPGHGPRLSDRSEKKNVLVHKSLCRGTVEEHIDGLVTDKQKLSDEILSIGAEPALTEMSNDELMSMGWLDLNSALEG